MKKLLTLLFCAASATSIGMYGECDSTQELTVSSSPGASCSCTEKATPCVAATTEPDQKAETPVQLDLFDMTKKSVIMGLVVNQMGRRVADILDINLRDLLQFALQVQNRQQGLDQAEAFLLAHEARLAKLVRLTYYLAKDEAAAGTFTSTESLLQGYAKKFSNLRKTLACTKSDEHKRELIATLTNVALTSCLLTTLLFEDVIEWMHVLLGNQNCVCGVITECLQQGNDLPFAQFLCGHETAITLTATQINPACANGVRIQFAKLHQQLAAGLNQPFGSVMLEFMRTCKKFLAPLPALVQQPCLEQAPNA